VPSPAMPAPGRAALAAWSTSAAESALLGSARRQWTGYCWPARVLDQYHQPSWNTGAEMSVSAVLARI